MSATKLTRDNFDQTISNSESPVLVDFWAEWCGPCKMLSPVIDELAKDQAGSAIVAKVNIDDEPDLAVKYGITAIPTLVVFRGGEPIKTLQGVHSKTALAQALATAA